SIVKAWTTCVTDAWSCDFMVIGPGDDKDSLQQRKGGDILSSDHAGKAIAVFDQTGRSSCLRNAFTVAANSPGASLIRKCAARPGPRVSPLRRMCRRALGKASAYRRPPREDSCGGSTPRSILCPRLGAEL